MIGDMLILVRTNESLKEELLKKGFPPNATIQYENELRKWLTIDAHLYIDLLFDAADKEAQETYPHLNGKPVLINCVAYTLKELNLSKNVIRLNGWPTLLQGKIAEIACLDEAFAKATMETLGWTYQLYADVIGFPTARVIATIVNEAYYAEKEGVADRKAIDTAMKLGTNYPFGPFEWADRIGLKNICDLLKSLPNEFDKYQLADNLSAS
jgi:3-hydroxybutyryl-CoA dehydrogenase